MNLQIGKENVERTGSRSGPRKRKKDAQSTEENRKRVEEQRPFKSQKGKCKKRERPGGSSGK